MTNDRPLEGRLAIVTGSSGRLGPLWTQALHAAGAIVVGIDLSDAQEDSHLDRSFAADVRDHARLRQVLAELERDLGPPHVLVNNAGIDEPPSGTSTPWRIEDVATEIFDETVMVNLTGTFNSIRTFGARMAEAGRGSIINIGSVYATAAPDPGLYDHLRSDPPFLKPPAYGASKAGVIQLTRYFARLWGPRGVRVNALSPGGVRGEQDAEFVRKYSARVPLRRMAEPSDLGGPLLFLASDDSSYLTGHNLQLDGGLSA